MADPASAISGGSNILGGLIAADASKSAARTAANAQVEAARLAAEESRFRPVAIRTGFGRSNFETDEAGRVSGASYELNPELQALRDRLIAQTGGQQGIGFTDQSLQAAQGLFGLGQQYLSASPEQAAQQWMSTQQAALAPQREQEMGTLLNRLTQTGTQGLGVAQAGGGQANPLMQAFANAQAQQNLDLAARAQEQGRAQTQFGSGLFSTGLNLASGGYAPLLQQLQAAQGIEGLGQSALDIGAQLGGRNANAAGANALLQGGMGAAQSNLAGSMAGINAMQQGINSASGMFSNYMNRPQTQMTQWNTNPGSQQSQMLAQQTYGM